MAAVASTFALCAPLAVPAASAAPVVSTIATPAAASRDFASVVGPGEHALSVVVPITAPATTNGIIDAETLARLTGPLGQLTAKLDALVGVPVTLAIDPAIPASIAALGSDVPASATQWIARLAEWETFPLLYADADPTLLTQSSLGAIPASAEPTGRWVPSLDGLALTTQDTVVASDIPQLAARAGNGIFVWSSQIEDIGDANAIATVDRDRILIVDAAASDWISRAASAGSVAPDDLEIDRDTIVVLDPTPTTALRGVLAALDASTTIAVVPLIEGIATAELDDEGNKRRETEVAIVDRPQDPERLAAFDRLIAEDLADAQFSAILEDPMSLTAADSARTIALASRAWLGDPTWTATIDDEVSQAAELRSRVRIVESDSLFLADRSGLPVAIENGLDQPITVDVRVSASNPRLELPDTPQRATVPAGSQATVSFDAVAVSNGTVRVAATISAPDGPPIGPAAIASVNVQAGWETPIVLAALGLLLLLMILGIVRTIRRNRRPRIETAAADASQTQETGTDE